MNAALESDGTLTINGGEAAVKALEVGGIEFAFGIVGSSIIEIFNLLPKAGIKYIGARHEQVASLMAEGYARLTKKPAVCLAQGGGGATNMVTGAANALKAQCPMVIIAGTPGTVELDRDTFQEADQLAAMRATTKWACRVTRSDRIYEYVQRALRTAVCHPMGPTYVEIPRDLLYEKFTMATRDFAPGKLVTRFGPDSTAVEEAMEMIVDARRPVIVTGSGALWSGASEEVCRLAAIVRAPIVTSYYHNDAVPSDDPWALGAIGRAGARSAMVALSDADLIVALGTKLDPFTTLPQYGLRYFPNDARVIHVDSDSTRLGRNSRLDLGVTSDLSLFLKSLIARLDGGRVNSEWTTDTIASLRSDWAAELSGVVATARSDGGSPLHNLVAWDVLKAEVPRDTIWVIDIGGTPSYVYHMIDFPVPGSLVAPGYLGSLGFCMSAALGAKLGAPERPVVGVLGDGGFTMTLSAMITGSEYEFDVLFVILDNGCWGAEWRNQQQFNNEEFMGTELNNPDLAELATACGWQAWRSVSEESLRDCLRDALKSHGPRAVVVEVDKYSLPKAARADALRVPERGLYR